MKKPALSQFKKGSAELVVAHARWRRSRRRRPSMFFVGEKNPRKALQIAQSICRRATRIDFIDGLAGSALQGRSFANMDDDELKFAVQRIVRTSSSEDEVRQRISAELQYPYRPSIHISVPTDGIGREARELVRGLGGLVMRNGAMLMGMMHGHDGTISF